MAKGQEVDTVINKPKKTDYKSDSIIFTRVEVEAQFPGGYNAWSTYLKKNLKGDTPVKNGAPAGRYNVVIKFIVSWDGKIKGIVPETKHSYGMEEEVMRIIAKGPKWIPASQNGKNVNSYKRQVVTFVVEGK
jgi:protein TonB